MVERPVKTVNFGMRRPCACQKFALDRGVHQVCWPAQRHGPSEHACELNCFAQEIIDEHDTLTLQMLTLRTIFPGKELVLDCALMTIDQRETPTD
jgi:hypothetical protein